MPFTALNGRLPDSLLTSLPWAEAAGFRLRADAAASVGRLAAAFYARFAAPLRLTDAYRTFATQVTLKASKGVWAATPGTSNHGLGIAIDFASGINVDGSVQHRWMEANAGRFGWINPPWATNWNPADGQHEAWHWEYHPELDTTPAPIVHAPPTVQEDEMRIINQPKRGIWLVGAGFAHHLTPDEWGQFRKYPHGLIVTTLPAGTDGEKAFDLLRTAYTKRSV